MPKVSIIMNCYNGEKYLREAIDSVYAQSFEDWEIIFWDNASTDQTPSIAATYGCKLKYFRSTQLLTLGAARREAVLMATGEWIAFLDCDDSWFSDKLQAQLDALSGTDYVLCYAGIREIDHNGRLIREVFPQHKSGQLLEKLLLQFDINMVTPMLRRNVLEQYRLNFDENVTASEEYNLFVRLAAKGKILALPTILGTYRVSAGTLTDRQISQWAVERYYTLEQLKQENFGIEKRYLKAFKEAYARGDYYKSRYLMTEGRNIEARQIMAGIVGLDYRYRLLEIALYIPGLWGLVHGKFMKRRIGPWLINLFHTKSSTD
jgi:glycosyltransferase involved in cell wall biosynthesis